MGCFVSETLLVLFAGACAVNPLPGGTSSVPSSTASCPTASALRAKEQTLDTRPAGAGGADSGLLELGTWLVNLRVSLTTYN